MSFRKRRGRWGSRGYGWSSPEPVEEGGIRARSKRGDIGESWWSKRWLSVMGEIDEDNRLPRGRTYARSGRVRSLEIQSGKVAATVMGSRLYQVSVTLNEVKPADWKRLAARFSEDASIMAGLLNGELPQEAEGIFEKLSIALLPQDEEDIDLRCNCPDWAIPCKHSAAIVYLIAEELDRDPFLLFRLRGIAREDFMKLLDVAPTAQAARPEELPPTPLPTEHKQFWRAFNTRQVPIPGLATPALHAALARRLGPFPFWQGNDPFIDCMEERYREASSNALKHLEEALLTLRRTSAGD